MKVIRLQSENVMRLVAVDITPEGHLVLVGGKNGAGKTSVLQSIAMALGGAALVPDEPLRQGETEGKIRVDLGDLIVTRTFKRLRYEDGSYGPTDTKLIVTNSDGATYPSPQALLDKLLGKLTFDPLSFKDAKGPQQADTLRKLVGLDFTTLNDTRAGAYAKRAILKKTLDIKTAQALKLPRHKDAPEQELSVDVINQQLQTAEQAQKKYAQIDAQYTLESSALSRANAAHEVALATLKIRQEALAAAEAAVTKAADELRAQQDKLIEIDQRRQETKNELPDMNAIRQQFTSVDLTNLKVRDNRKYLDAQAELLKLQTDVEEQDGIIQDVDVEKYGRLQSAQYPVAGLGLTDDGVTFNGLPFSQASASEQVRVSVAIGMALNPQLKILLVRNGNVLDDDSLKAVAEQVAKDDYQVWCEYVTKDASDVNIMIEDGSVVVAPAEPAAAVGGTTDSLPF